MTEPTQPSTTNVTLDTPDKLQIYLNSCPPGLTKLNLAGKQIPYLQGVKFPSDLIEINFYGSQINNLKGVRFPSGLKILELTHNQISSLEGVHFPSGLTKLSLILNQITTLEGVQFPPGLIELNLGQNKISSLDMVQFPPGLRILKVDHNQLTSLAGVQFPPELVELELSLNYKITSLEGVQFPNTLMRLSMHGTPLKSLTGIISPNKYVIESLKQQFLHLYLRDLHPEKLALKATRQSQKSSIKEMADLSQNSMQNQLRAITSFLREGMQLRAQQHAEQLSSDREGKPTKYEESLFYAKLKSGKKYPIPMNEEMSIQEVLNYLNENYYISILRNCVDMHINKPGVGKLDSSRTLKECGVVSDDVLEVVCRTQQGGFRHNRYSKKQNHNKRSKKTKNQRNKTIKLL
jgi:hypothetical protein